MFENIKLLVDIFWWLIISKIFGVDVVKFGY